MSSFIESVNLIRQKLAIIESANGFFSEEVLLQLQEITSVDLSLIVADFEKGNYLGNRKIDIDLALNNLSTTELPTYKQADVVLVSGVKLEMPFDNGSGGILELSSHADIKSYITAHLLYAQVVDTEFVVTEAFGDTPAMMRVRDADGKASNIERIELHVYTGTVADTKPTYFWAKTTSSLETLANRVGDIIQLGNDIDSIVTLSQRIDELIALQAEISKIIDVHTNLASVVTAANNITSINTTAANINALNALAAALTALNAIYTDLADILAASTHAQTATDQAAIATAKANEIKSITAQAQTLSAGSAASASYNPVDGKLTFGIPQGLKGDKGDSFTVNAVGLLAQKSLYDLQPTGFSFLAVDEAYIYFKLSATSGDWSLGSPFGKGETGDTGATGNGIASVTFVGTTDVSGFAAQSGATDTYRITFTDTTTSDFTIHNGLDSDVYMVDLTSHTNRTDNPHTVTKAQVGLGNVDNTSDANKPVSIAQQEALDLKANDSTVMKLAGDQVITDTKEFEKIIVSDLQYAPTSEIYQIGTKGEVGFGVATATQEQYNAIGAIPMEGHDNKYSDNYGNYLHVMSGAILVYIPKHYYKATGNVYEFSMTADAGFVLDRSFINGGVEIKGVFISKYGGTKNGTMFSSQAGQMPMSTGSTVNPISALAGTPANTYGGLYTAVKSMDSKAFLTPIFYYSMLARLAKAHGEAAVSTTACAFIDVEPKHPKGNLNNALSDVNDTSVTFKSAGHATYPYMALTGSGSNLAKTTHNGQNCGVADLNGNMWEVASGFIKFLTTDGNFKVLKESVDIRAILNDSTTVGTGAYDAGLYDTIDLSDLIVDTTAAWTYLGNGTNQVFPFSAVRTDAAYKRAACGIPSALGVSVAGTTEFGNDGIYKARVNEMACIVGGNWSNTSFAGAFAMYLAASRANSLVTTGGRASFLV